MGYTSESIYQIYFPDSRRIKTVRDLEFDKSYNYQEIGITVEEDPLFFFPKIEPFTNNTFNTPVKEEEELSAISSTPSTIHSKAKDDSNSFSSASSDNNSAPLQRSAKICHKPIGYGLVTQYIALSSVAQSEIHEPLSYNEAI